MSCRAWLLLGWVGISPLGGPGQTDREDSSSSSATVSPEPEPERPRATRVELGVSVGDYVFSVGSATQLHYAPTADLRLAYGLARIGAIGFVRVAAPIDLPGSVASQTRQFASGGGLGLRSLFVQRPRVRFGLVLLGSVERLDSRTRLPALPGLDEPEHVQRRVVQHAGVALGHELQVMLPVRRGPTMGLTFGTSLAFVFPIAAARSGSDVAETHYSASQLGLISVLGGATLLINIGVTLGWDQGGDRAGAT